MNRTEPQISPQQRLTHVGRRQVILCKYFLIHIVAVACRCRKNTYHDGLIPFCNSHLHMIFILTWYRVEMWLLPLQQNCLFVSHRFSSSRVLRPSCECIYSSVVRVDGTRNGHHWNTHWGTDEHSALRTLSKANKTASATDFAVCVCVACFFFLGQKREMTLLPGLSVVCRALDEYRRHAQLTSHTTKIVDNKKVQRKNTRKESETNMFCHGSVSVG